MGNSKEGESSVNYFIYFFKNQVGRIKIGYTDNLERRQKQLENMTGPLTLLNASLTYETEQEAKEAESALHRKFAHVRQHGEFFDPDPELLTYISALGKPEQLPECDGVAVKRRAVSVQVLTINGKNLTEKLMNQLPVADFEIVYRMSEPLLFENYWGWVATKKTVKYRIIETTTLLYHSLKKNQLFAIPTDQWEYGNLRSPSSFKRYWSRHIELSKYNDKDKALVGKLLSLDKIEIDDEGIFHYKDHSWSYPRQSIYRDELIRLAEKTDDKDIVNHIASRIVEYKQETQEYNRRKAIFAQLCELPQLFLA